MLVVVSQPLINDFWLEGTISQSFLDCLKEKFGDDFRIEKMDEDEEWVDVEECDWYKEALEHDNPQENLRFYRELADLTQKQLGERIGVSSRFVSDMEHGRRAISKKMAKSLSDALKVPADRFL